MGTTPNTARLPTGRRKAMKADSCNRVTTGRWQPRVSCYQDCGYCKVSGDSDDFTDCDDSVRCG